MAKCSQCLLFVELVFHVYETDNEPVYKIIMPQHIIKKENKINSEKDDFEALLFEESMQPKQIDVTIMIGFRL